MNTSAVLAVLGLIEQVLQMIGSNSATASLIDNIINTLVELLPYIGSGLSTIYQSMKNIIAQLRTKGDPTDDQLAALDRLDTQVDAAWDAIESKIDPDA